MKSDSTVLFHHNRPADTALDPVYEIVFTDWALRKPSNISPLIVSSTIASIISTFVPSYHPTARGGASGSFELNVGLTANLDRARALAESSPAIVTPLNKVIGYEAAAKVAKHAVAHAMTVREAVLDLGFVERGEVTLAQLDTALDVLSMTHPG
jgi:fumarate hydratase class II